MPASEAQRIFISYARNDGAELAQRLQVDLQQRGYQPWLDKQRIEGGASWTDSIEQAIDEADYLLALLTPGSYRSEICRAEQLRSLRKGKCVIPLLAQQGSEIPLHLEAKNYLDFSAAGKYAQSFNELLTDLHDRNGVVLREEFRATSYVTVPPLPVNFVERPEAVAALRNALMADDGGRHVALTALQGMGGIGKTVLAQALCCDEVVQQAFPDGVVWVTIGKEAQFDPLTRVREVARALGDDPSRYGNLLTAKNEYRTTLTNKAVLIVVDDVWRSSDLEPFLAENSPRSRLLFTTRDASIAAAVGAREHLAELLSEQKSREVLARWAGTDEDKLPPIASNLIQECGYLPLALSMVGAMVRGKPDAYWKRVLELLRGADLAKIKAQFPDYPYTDVLRALQVSVDALDDTARERYLALAVLLEEMSVAPEVQRCIWGVGEGEAVETAEQFISLSLAQRGETEGSIKLHDLQLDYVRAQWPREQEEALELIHAAIRRSSYVIARDPGQFASQMIGRLLPYRELKPIQQFLKTLDEGTRLPWLRPVRGSLASEQSQRWLRPSSGTLHALAFSRNGRWAAHSSYGLGDERSDVVVWDLKEWRCVGPRFRAISRLDPYALVLNDDASWCLYADSIGGVHRLGEAGAMWEGHGHRKVTIALWLGISGDGKRALSGCQHGRLVAWDIDANRHEIIWDENDNYFQAICVDGAGRRAVVARADGSVVLVEILPRSVRCLCTVDGEPTALAVSFDNSVFAVAVESGRVEVHRFEEAKPIAAFSIEEKPTSLAISADLRQVAVGTEKGTLDIWSLAASELTTRYPRAHAYDVNQVSFSQDGAHVISGDNVHLKEWLIRNPGRRAGVATPTYATGQVKVTHDGLRALAVLEDGHLGVWDLETGELESTLQGADGCSFGDSDIGPAEHLSLATHKSEVLAWNKKLLCVWDLATGKCLGTSRATGKAEAWQVEIRDAAITSDGTGVVYLDGMNVSFWNPGEGELRILGKYVGDPPRHVAVSPDGKFALSCGGDRKVNLWRLSGPPNPYLEKIRRILNQQIGERRSNLEPDANYWPESRDKPSGITFAAEAEAVVITGDGSVFLLKIEDDPSQRPSLEGWRLGHHAGGLPRIIASLERKLFLTSSLDGSTTLWDLEGDRHVTVPIADYGTVGQLSSSARRILLSTYDGVLKVVQVSDGALVAAFQADKQIVSFASDAEIRHIVGLDQGGEMHFLRLEEPK